MFALQFMSTGVKCVDAEDDRNVVAHWATWKTIMIGGTSTDELLELLAQHGFKVSAWAKDLMQQPAFVCGARETEIDLVYLTPRDLGFTEAPTTPELFARAKERGLKLCPAEVGPRLRLNYPEQLAGDYIWVGMEPIVSSEGYPRVFLLGHVRGFPWLLADFAYPGDRWALACPFVFARK